MENDKLAVKGEWMLLKGDCSKRFCCIYIFSRLINDTLVNGLNRVGSVYTKFVYKRYTDAYYTTEIPSPPSQGFVGPTLKGETGDLIRIHLRNLAPVAISMHPHGVLYDKANEGMSNSSICCCGRCYFVFFIIMNFSENILKSSKIMSYLTCVIQCNISWI